MDQNILKQSDIQFQDTPSDNDTEPMAESEEKTPQTQKDSANGLNESMIDSTNDSKTLLSRELSGGYQDHGDNIAVPEECTSNPESEEGCEDCKDISLEDFEMEDLSDSHDSTTCEAPGAIDEQVEEDPIPIEPGPNTAANTRASLPQQASDPPPCVLRHRLDPEPPRSAIDGNSAAVEEESKPKSSKDLRKLAEIQKALDADPVDVESLRKLAISPGGLINKHMRQRVWPLLINVNTNNIIPPKPAQEEMEAMTKTYNQVVMDVNRSSSRFPPGIDDHVRMSMKDKLVDLIMRVMLHHHGQLKYYQGFHDVCVTFLLCMDEDMSFAMVNKLSVGYMREYLDDTMERTSLLLNYIYPLINRCNPELCEHMQRNDLGTIFALSWVITWFSHVLGDIRRIFRVFDFFLASHRMMPVYLSAAFVLHREGDIFDAGDEMGYIHKCLSVIPPNLPLESLLERAGDLYLQYPPTEISRDPMLINLNNQVYDHFNRIESRNEARRRLAQQQSSHLRSRLFVRATMWTVTAVVGVAVAVLYHTYSSEDWSVYDPWSHFS